MSAAWRDDAACLTADPEIFFPDPSDVETALDAKSFCDRCTVTAECLTFAIRTRQDHGIWGGVNEGGRANIGGSRGCRDCNADVERSHTYCPDCAARRYRAKKAAHAEKRRIQRLVGA